MRLHIQRKGSHTRRQQRQKIFCGRHFLRQRQVQQYGRRVLEQYLSGPENSDFAFVHHGSLVPVQFYLYQDLLARAQDKAGLLRLYPAMRR